MSLQEKWKPKVDGQDDILAEDINNIADAVIANEKKIEGLKSQVNILQNDFSYNFTELQGKTDELGVYIEDLNNNKADKTYVENLSYADTQYSYVFSDAFEARCLTPDGMSLIEFNFTNGEIPDTFTSGLVFYSGETPTEIGVPNTGAIYWKGADCALVDGKTEFTPSPNTYYEVVFNFNGVCVMGRVDSFTPEVSV